VGSTFGRLQLVLLNRRWAVGSHFSYV
jgi:hypothetical protein